MAASLQPNPLVEEWNKSGSGLSYGGWLERELRAARANMASEGVRRIASERRRQIEREDWSPEHDDKYQCGELISAAASYALINLTESAPSTLWPWSWDWWKPSGPIRNLEKSGALIAAEIDRLRRAARKEAQGC